MYLQIDLTIIDDFQVDSVNLKDSATSAKGELFGSQFIISYDSILWLFKTVLNVKVSTQNDFIYGEVCWNRLVINNKHRRIIKYWLKLIRQVSIDLFKIFINDTEQYWAIS